VKQKSRVSLAKLRECVRGYVRDFVARIKRQTQKLTRGQSGARVSEIACAAQFSHSLWPAGQRPGEKRKKRHTMRSGWENKKSIVVCLCTFAALSFCPQTKKKQEKSDDVCFCVYIRT
jgi:hypothetical protein